MAALAAAATKQEQAAAQALNQARQQAAKIQARAQALLIAKPPTGQDPCTAASKAFDEELKTERENSK